MRGSGSPPWPSPLLSRSLNLTWSPSPGRVLVALDVFCQGSPGNTENSRDGFIPDLWYVSHHSIISEVYRDILGLQDPRPVSLSKLWPVVQIQTRRVLFKHVTTSHSLTPSLFRFAWLRLTDSFTFTHFNRLHLTGSSQWSPLMRLILPSYLIYHILLCHRSLIWRRHIK